MLGFGPQVLDRARRSEVGEHQVVVVPHRRRPLRREVRRAVRADGGDEAELGLDDPLHVLGQDPHGQSRGPARIRRNSMRRSAPARGGADRPARRAPERPYAMVASSCCTVGPLPAVYSLRSSGSVPRGAALPPVRLARRCAPTQEVPELEVSNPLRAAERDTVGVCHPVPWGIVHDEHPTPVFARVTAIDPSQPGQVARRSPRRPFPDEGRRPDR